MVPCTGVRSIVLENGDTRLLSWMDACAAVAITAAWKPTLERPGIIASLREVAPQSSLLQSNDQESTLVAVVDAARGGDLTATQVLKDTAHYLGAGIANLVNLFNPQLICR